MKKSLLILLVLLVGLNSQAQLKKGRMMINGNFNFGRNYASNSDTASHSNQLSDYRNFSGSLRYGYLVKDNVMVGILGSYGSGASKNDFINSGLKNSYSSTTNSFSAGLFSRYYKPIVKTRFALFGQLSSSYSRNEYTTKEFYPSNTPQKTTTKGANSTFNIGLNGGITWFPNDVFALEATIGNIGYNTQLTDNVHSGSSIVRKYKNSNFSSNFSFSSIYFGLSFYFGGKKETKEEVKKDEDK